MIEFKKIPVITHYDENDDESDPRDHYKISILTGYYGKVKMKEDFDEENDSAMYEVESDFEKDEFMKLVGREFSDLSAIKSVFLEKSCSIPVAKFRKFGKERGIEIARSKEKADLIVYGKKFIDNLLSEKTNRDFVTKKNLVKKINQMKKDREKFDDIPLKLQEIVDDDLVMLKWCSDLIPNKDRIKGNCWIVEDNQSFEDIESGKYLYCNQDTIMGNMGSEIIDETMFERLCQMFDSNDKSNTIVAMEVMANCNYEKSILYLLELMRLYYAMRIYYTTSRYHVSFKALIDWLGKYEPRFIDDDYNTIVEIICRKNLMTEANYRRVLEFILKKDIADKDNGQSAWIPVTIDLAERWKKYIIWDKKPDNPFVNVQAAITDPL